MNTVMNILVSKYAGNFLTSSGDVGLSRRTQLRGVRQAVTAMRCTRLLKHYKTFSSDRTKFIGGRMVGTSGLHRILKYETHRDVPQYSDVHFKS
jgi:hypothetical protein